MDIVIPGYTLGKQIGKGGMGSVFLARQENMGRDVAIKIFTPTLEAEQNIVERFLQEAKTIATLNHAHIIPVYDVGQIGVHYYIVMEYLPANTLSHWIKTGLEPQEALDVIQQMAEALYYSHQKGIVHRDIKPDNIMFREDHSAVLLDFGIAQLEKSEKHLTQQGQMIGTPAYMSPEQARGQKVTAPSDLYSLGVVLYEALTKQKPYDAEDAMGIAMKHIMDPVPVLPAVVQRFQPLIDKLMAKDVALRFRNGLEVSKTIKQFGGGLSSDVKAPVPSIEKSGAAAQNDGAVSAVMPEAEKPELNLQERVVDAPTKNLEVEISFYRKALFFKRSGINIKLVSADVAQFQVQFGRVGEQLLSWSAECGRQAKTVHLQFFCKPWLQGPIEKSVRQMVGSKDPYGFLSKLDMRVSLYTLSGELIADYSDF